MTNIQKDRLPSKLNALETYLNGKYEFVYDYVGNIVLQRKKGEDKYTQVHLNTLLHEVRKNVRYFTHRGPSGDFSDSFLKQLISSRLFSPEFNPIRNFLERLPESNNSDPFKDLAKLLVLEDENEEELAFTVNAFKKWFVGVVKSVYEDNYVPKQMLVLRSTQENIGKSSLLNSFLPAPLRRYGAFNPPLKNANKDSSLKLVNCFIVFFDEIDLFLDNKDNRQSFKAFASQPFVNVRPAYAADTEFRPRIASFLGTCNGLEFTSKSSGKSRFIVLSVRNIWNKKALKKAGLPIKNPAELFDVNNLWSEAYRLYKNGYNPRYDDNEMEDIIERNTKHMISCEVTDLVLKSLKIGNETSSASEFLMTSEIKYYLNSRNTAAIFSLKKLGQVLNELGYKKVAQKINGNTVRGWWVEKIDQKSAVLSSTPWVESRKSAPQKIQHHTP